MTPIVVFVLMVANLMCAHLISESFDMMSNKSVLLSKQL